MARPQRILYENAFYHVMNRGAGRQTIFFDDTARYTFLKMLDEAHQRFHIEIHAYCLMDNHYHLLIKTPDANLSRAMQYIDAVYTQRHNYRNQIDGPLFRGRYKAIVVDSDTYLLHLSKYIHLNPLKAGIVESLCDYPWSSYLSYIGKASRPNYLFRDEVYAQITQNKTPFLLYQDFMNHKDLDKKLIQFYEKPSQSLALGSDDFLIMLSKKKGHKEILNLTPKYITIDSIIETVSSAFKQPSSTLLKMTRGRQKSNTPRKIALYAARMYGDYQLKELASIFGFTHTGGVSHAIYSLKKELQEDPVLEALIKKLFEK